MNQDDPLFFLSASPQPVQVQPAVEVEDLHARQRRVLRGEVIDLEDAEILIEIRKLEFLRVRKVFALASRMEGASPSSRCVDNAREAHRQAWQQKREMEPAQVPEPAPEAVMDAAPVALASRFSPAQLAELEQYKLLLEQKNEPNTSP